ncbi:MAG: class II fructose-bisphosphatase [Pseudomonadota bacterium]
MAKKGKAKKDVAEHDVEESLDRKLTLELARVTEAAAVAAALWRGKGDEKAADQAAVDAMRRELNFLPIRGTVRIGEGERDEAPMLYIGEEVGTGEGPELDVALDPLEGTTICAKNTPNSLAVIALARTGNLLNAPDCYMEKIAVGPGYPDGIISLDAPASANIEALAKAKDVKPEQVRACVLDRPRHAQIIEDIRKTGASIRLIGDGDVAGVIHTTDPDETGIDIYIGTGGAPEGVLAAAALRCTGGQMLGRLVIANKDQHDRASKMGIDDPSKIFSMDEMARGDVLFAATGVTDGNFLKGVRLSRDGVETDTVVMRSSTRTIRYIKGVHRETAKFRIN